MSNVLGNIQCFLKKKLFSDNFWVVHNDFSFINFSLTLKKIIALVVSLYFKAALKIIYMPFL